MREEFVKLKNKYKKLQYKNFEKFNKETEIKNDFKNVRKIPMVLAYMLFILIEVLFIKFLPLIFSILFGIFIVYLFALICFCIVEINVKDNKIFIKKFIFKKVINAENIKKMYLTTSKNEVLGGLRAKIKIIYKTEKSENIYSIDTMFLRCDKVEKLLKIIQVEPLTKEEEKGEFDKTKIIDQSLLELVDFVFLIPMALCVLVDFIM